MKKMIRVFWVLLIILLIIVVWFKIQYSPVKKEFDYDVEKHILDNKLLTDDDVFTEEEFKELPVVVQKFISNCGYIGTPKMSYLRMYYHDVDFMQGKTGPALKIDYTQYNFVYEPCRLAFIDSSMFGIPFQGYDYYTNGTGGMKGVIAKLITLFDQKGEAMDRACLVTFLAESMFAPTILLQEYISFEPISDYEVRATIDYKGQIVSGVFSFNEQYEMISFTTNDRAVISGDGSVEYVPWSAVCGDYAMSESGIKYPTSFKAVWNYSDGDFVYFDGQISAVDVDTKK